MHEFERLRSRRTLVAAEEGDPVLFTESHRDRKQPLKVTDTGGSAADGYYLVVQGPRGGTYTIRERDDGRLSLGESSGNKRVTNLRFADVADSADAAYREQREAALSDALGLLDSDAYDYSEFAVAVADAASDRTATLDQSDLRAVLLGAPTNAGDTHAYAHAPHDEEARQLAYAVLVDDLQERGADVAGTRLDGSIETRADVDHLVDKGVVQLRDYLSSDQSLDQATAAETAARILCDELSTTDHQALIDFLPRPEAGLVARLAFDVGEMVPWGDRTTAYERAVAYLTAAVIEEETERREAELQGDRELYSLEGFFERFIDEDIDKGDLRSQFTVPKLPLLSDGGMPHTTLDEATKIYLRDVPVIAGDWQLLDGGLVHDDQQRRMAWGNESGNLVLMASVANGTGNDWRVWALDLEADSTTPLYDGQSFDDALDTVIEYIAPDEGRAAIQFSNDGNTVTVEEDVDEQALGQQLVAGMGVAGDVAADAFSAMAPVVGAGGRLAGRAALATGKATGGAAAGVFGQLWRRYPLQVGQFLLGTVGMALLHNGGKVLAGGKFTPVVEKDRLGFEFGYNKGATIVDKHGNVSAKHWEAAEFDLDRGQYRLVNERSGEEVWVAPGAKEDVAKVRKTVNPYETHIADGSTLAWGVGYDEIADVFAAWGEDVAEMTLGHGEGHTWKPSPTGSPDSGKRSPSNPFASSRSSSKSSGSLSSKSSRSKSSSKKSSSSSGVEGTPYENVSESEWGRMGEVRDKLLKADASGLMSKLATDRSPTEAAQEMEAAETKPNTADEIEEAVGDADRTEQLEHPNRSEEVDVEVTEADVEGPAEDYDERKDQHREQEEEAAAYYESRSPDEQAELEETHEEAERIRSFEGGEESTTGGDEFDLGEALERTRESRERRQASSAEEAFWADEMETREAEALEFGERENFWADEESDPALEDRL